MVDHDVDSDDTNAYGDYFCYINYLKRNKQAFVVISGDNVYYFNNKTAVDVPAFLLEYTGDEVMTISTWIWMKRRDQQQFILAATDPQRLDRKHFGLYTEGN